MADTKSDAKSRRGEPADRARSADLAHLHRRSCPSNTRALRRAACSTGKIPRPQVPDLRARCTPRRRAICPVDVIALTARARGRGVRSGHRHRVHDHHARSALLTARPRPSRSCSPHVLLERRVDAARRPGDHRDLDRRRARRPARRPCGSPSGSAAAKASAPALGQRRRAASRHFEWTGEPDAAHRDLPGARGLMDDIAIIGWGRTPLTRRTDVIEPQLLPRGQPRGACAMAGVSIRDIGFTCSGSCDYLSGGPFVVRAEPRGHRGLAAQSPTRTSRWTAPGRCTRRGCACRRATSTSPSSPARASPRPSRPGTALPVWRWTRTSSRRWAPGPGVLRRPPGPGADRRRQGHRARFAEVRPAAAARPRPTRWPR